MSPELRSQNHESVTNGELICPISNLHLKLIKIKISLMTKFVKIR